MMAKRILVPLDGSESAEVAAALAADLARGSGGDVRLLQVHPVPEQRVGNFGRVVAYADQEMESSSSHSLDYLRTLETYFTGVPVESVVRFGDRGFAPGRRLERPIEGEWLLVRIGALRRVERDDGVGRSGRRRRKQRLDQFARHGDRYRRRRRQRSIDQHRNY